MRTEWQSRSRATLLALAVILFTLGCAPSVTFFGDQALLATIAERSAFEDSLHQAAEKAGQRLAIRWDPSEQLATSWLEEQLADLQTPVVVLSPYFSLFASEFADAHEDLSIVAFTGGGSDRTNLTRVAFDRISALESAGELVRSWEEAGSDRKAAVLYVAGSDARDRELDALLAAYTGAGSAELAVRRFGTPPDRETVRREIRDLLAEGTNAFLVFAGASNRFALELLRSEPVVFATDFAASATSLDESLLFSIEERLDTGLETALAAINSGDEGQLVTTSSLVAVGRGFENPQLTRAPTADEGAAADGQ
jgi:hypothetical protein